VTEIPDPEVPEKATRRRFTADYKLAIVEEYDGLTEPGARGALLRREGLYSSHIAEWRRARDAGALQALGRTRGRKPADARDAEVARLRRRAERAEAELAKTKLIIEVQGKVSALLEAISESAEPGNDSTR
jgi:transposase-like protein